MRINRLSLENFRGFKRFEKSLNKRFTLIVGDNGVGKTTLLDALSVAFGAFLLGIPNARSRSIHKEEAHEDAREYNGALDFISSFPIVVEAEGTITGSNGEKNVKWKRELLSPRGRTTYVNSAEIKNEARLLYESLSDKRDVTLPLLNYYGTGRLWEEPKRFLKESKPSRFDAYKHSHEARVSSADLLDWIEKERLLELERDQKSPRLRAWKRAVESCFEENVSISYSPSRRRTEVTFLDTRQTISFENLSHGQRNVLSMVGDIAFKSLILNPHLEEEAVSGTPGIVLIDEIDLHLHPKWQRVIVPTLLKSFPKIQFFATTHSPFIIQSLVEGSLLNLDRMEFDDDVYNINLLEIIEEVQEVEIPERSALHSKKVRAASYFSELAKNLSNEDDPERIKYITSEMDKIIRDTEDPALAALLKIEKISARES